MLGEYDSNDALKLLAKDQEDLLQYFSNNHTELLGAASEAVVFNKSDGQKLQLISLARGLLEFSGGREECQQHALNQDYTVNDNANTIGLSIGITGINQFGIFDPKEMHNALSKSKVFAENQDIDLVDYSQRLMESLPIGFQDGYWV